MPKRKANPQPPKNWKPYFQAIGSKGGSVKSAAKTEAGRRNAAKARAARASRKAEAVADLAKATKGRPKAAVEF